MFVAPTQVVLGANTFSQRWADTTTERGIEGCGWKAPVRAKPPTTDARKAVRRKPGFVTRKPAPVVEAPVQHEDPVSRFLPWGGTAKPLPTQAPVVETAPTAEPPVAAQPPAVVVPTTPRKPPGWFARWRERHFPRKPKQNAN